jgi:dTDP-4-amino-4,6-dideoxygalactose transaminase
MTFREIPPVRLYFPQEDVRRIETEVGRILESGMLTLGEYTERFESEWARMVGSRYAVAVNSGTAALEIALRTLGVGEGDEVLVPTNTFTATAASVIFSGAKPILTDVDPESLCLNSENMKKYLTHRTKAVIAVHIGGLVCPDIEAIRELCQDHGVYLVEDAAHAHGSTLRGQFAGHFGDSGCFSFYPTKVMTTGEGGMLTTDDESIARKARILRDQGKESFNSSVVVELGCNWRMNEISAALGLSQLGRLPEILDGRRRAAKYYDNNLSAAHGLRPMTIPEGANPNYYKYIAFLSPDIDRDRLKLKLRERGVRLSGEVYWPPLHLQPIYERLLATKRGDFPAAESACSRMICLPIFAQMSDDDLSYVSEMIREALSL